MADERVAMLSIELNSWEQRLRVLAVRMEELASVDCPLGECILDPRMDDLQEELSDALHHREMIKDVLRILERSGVA
jgi:uncharacterized protein YlaN (UPF0358 family)